MPTALGRCLPFASRLLKHVDNQYIFDKNMFLFQVTDFEYLPERNVYRFMLRGGKTVMHDLTPYRYIIFPYSVYLKKS